MISTIFKKELKDTLRDRRTLMTMIIIPIFIFPVIMTVFLKVSEGFAEDVANKTVNIGIVVTPENMSFVKTIENMPKMLGKKKVYVYHDSATVQKHMQENRLQFGVFVPENFAKNSIENKTSKFKIFYNATEMGMKDRAEAFLNAFEEMEKAKRYKALKVDPASLSPITFDYRNVASDKETVGKLIGGFLPYLFIVFGFVGCMYPAIDLFTGEKERGTLETLLTTPVSRLQILLGKMCVVVLSGVMAATFTLLGIFLSIEVFQIVKDPKLLEIIHQILTVKFILLMYLLLIPLIVFFAGVMIPITVYAKSFKEAQSIITPLNMVMILPAMVGFFPGIELNAITACIPVVNVVLATKELIAGTLDIGLLLLSFGVMTSLALMAILFSYKRFDRESNLVS